MPALPTISRPGSKITVGADLVHVLAHDVGIGARQRRRGLVVAVGNAEAAAEIDMLDGVAVRAQLAWTRSAISAKALSNGSRSVIWLPICMSMPMTRRPGRAAARA